MLAYTGKVPCPGCEKTGEQSPRYNKASLCWECKKTLELGRAKDVELKVKYVRVFVHYHGSYRTKFVSDMVHRCASCLDNQYAPSMSYEGEGWYNRTYSFGNNGMTYKINEDVFKALRDYWKELDDKVYALEEEIKRLPERVKKEVQEERTRIYNEGIERGKNMLLQLAEGGITMKDFEERIPYHKPQ